jgi:predicted nucleotide-binding protein (sugar kinase/HSP70/actin superfamily)
MTEIETPKNLKPDEKKEVMQAYFSEDLKFIIDSEGQKIDFEDPRIVYVDPEPRNPYGRRLVINLFKKNNRNIRISKETDTSVLQYAKNICSGRECLPSVAIAGAVLKDIEEYRNENEITIYRTPIDNHGPCQNGAWPVLWGTFSKRLKIKNAIFCAFPKYTNNYLGLNRNLLAWENINFIAGQYLIEARNALQCVAENKVIALKKFEDLTSEFIDSVKDERKTLNTGLLKWAKEVAKIPLKASIEETPKVLIFGGLNLMFDHYPIEDFFLEKGIIVKVVDIVEGMSMILAESTIRFGFKKGLITPKEQFNEQLLHSSELEGNDQKEFQRTKRNKNALNFLNSQCKIFRRIIGKSGLLFDPYVDFIDLFEEGNKYVSSNSLSETTIITGRFLHSIKDGIYDGLVNLGTFNCQPAMNSQAIIRPLANKCDIPYAAIDCEGPWISTNQYRLLETIAVQAKRVRKEKNEHLVSKSIN